MAKVVCIVGTRPEGIKMAPVILQLRRMPGFEVLVYSTGQHRELLIETLSPFRIALDRDLAVMSTNQSLSTLTSRLTSALDEALEEEKPDLVLVQGDTTSVMVAGM